MADIKQILNKKGWTGRELGILELTNMAIQYNQVLHGEEAKPIIEASQLQKMVNDIRDREQGRIYNGYISIHDWLSVKYNIAQTQLQQAQLQIRTIEGFTTPAIIAEDVFRYIEQLPAIMTQKQYDEIKAERTEARFKDEDGGESLAGFYELVETALAFFLHKLQTEPKKPNPLKEIRKLYIKQPVKSNVILSQYNEATCYGYYTLEDGRRSDELSEDEWREAVIAPEMLKLYSKTDYQRVIERARIIYNGGTKEEADKAQYEADRSQGYVSPTQWHYYDEPPADLTKWEIIEEELLIEFYPLYEEASDKAVYASLQDFRKEFPELIAAMLKEIDRHYFKGKELSKLTEEEQDRFTISRRELYNMGFFGERDIVESNTFIFDGNKRAIFNGVAILQPSGWGGNINDNGGYKEPDIKPSLINYSLEAFFPEAEDYANNIEVIETTRETLLDSYYFVLGYNYLIDRIAAVYDVPELTVFKLEIDALAERIEAINNLTPVLYEMILDTDYQDKELQAKKLQVLKDFFQDVDYKALAIPEENKAQIEELLEDFKAFEPNNADILYKLACIRQKEEGA